MAKAARAAVAEALVPVKRLATDDLDLDLTQMYLHQVGRRMGSALGLPPALVEPDWSGASAAQGKVAEKIFQAQIQAMHDQMLAAMTGCDPQALDPTYPHTYMPVIDPGATRTP